MVGQQKKFRFVENYFTDINAISVNNIYISSDRKIITISNNQINIISNKSFENFGLSISNKVNSMLGASKSNFFVLPEKKDKKFNKIRLSKKIK